LWKLDVQNDVEKLAAILPKEMPVRCNSVVGDSPHANLHDEDAHSNEVYFILFIKKDKTCVR